jgi:hypothetical protein
MVKGKLQARWLPAEKKTPPRVGGAATISEAAAQKR